MGRGINRLLAFATMFFGITVTAVSENWPPQNLTQELTRWRTVSCRISLSHSLFKYEQFCTALREWGFRCLQLCNTLPRGSLGLCYSNSRPRLGT